MFEDQFCLNMSGITAFILIVNHRFSIQNIQSAFFGCVQSSDLISTCEQSTKPIIVRLIQSLLRLGLSEVAQNLHHRWGTTLYRYPVCDTFGNTEIFTTNRHVIKFNIIMCPLLESIHFHARKEKHTPYV